MEATKEQYEIFWDSPLAQELTSAWLQGYAYRLHGLTPSVTHALLEDVINGYVWSVAIDQNLLSGTESFINVWTKDGREWLEMNYPVRITKMPMVSEWD